MERNWGTTVTITTPRTAIITGTATTSSRERVASSLIAMKMPPTHMIGAMTISVRAICTNIWICWISLVLRVISDAVPKWFISLAEKVCTLLKTTPRMSAPAPIATCDA